MVRCDDGGDDWMTVMIVMRCDRCRYVSMMMMISVQTRDAQCQHGVFAVELVVVGGMTVS